MPLFYLTKGNNKMAVMKCEECGNDVSTKAQICQKCGAPAPSDADYEAFLQEQKRAREAKKEEAKAKREQERATEAKKEEAKAKSDAKLAPKRRIRKYALHWLWISPVLFVVAVFTDQLSLLFGALIISWFGAVLVVCIPKAIWVAVPLTLLTLLFGIFVDNTPRNVGKTATKVSTAPVGSAGDREVIPMDSFYSCIEQMEIVLSNIGYDNRITVVDSSVMKWVKMPTSDGSVNVVCSKPDKNMVITQHQR